MSVASSNTRRRISRGAASFIALVAVVTCVGIGGFGYVMWLGHEVVARKHHTTLEFSPSRLATADVKRGERWVKGVARCVECHAPDLGGKIVVDSGVGRFAAPNISPNEGSAVAGYDALDWVRAIRHGVDPNGRGLWLMPAARYRRIADADLADMIAYLQQSRSVDRVSSSSDLSWFGQTLLGLGRLPLIAADAAMQPPPRERPPTTQPVAFGRYLVGVAGCADCHGTELKGGVPMTPAAPALHQARAATWSTPQWRTFMRTGKRPDGSSVDESVMPVRDYMLLLNDEIDAIRAFLAASDGGL